MIAKEKKELLRLRVENAELRAAVSKHLDIYRENSWELVDLRIKIDLIESALKDDHD